MNSTSLFLIPFLIWSLVRCIDATKYVCTNTVPNTPGGQTFDKEIGVAYVEQVMPEISEFIFKVFKEKNVKDRQDVPLVNIYITDLSGYAGLESANKINISAPSIQRTYFPRSKSKFFLYALLLHETTHVFQWNGNFGAPTGLTEGIADYVMMKSGYYDKIYNTKPGEGNKWDDGYGNTARFLEYCDTLLNGFTAKLNKMMRYQYRDSYWVDLLGKPVDQLWRDYKAKYGKLTTS